MSKHKGRAPSTCRTGKIRYRDRIEAKLAMAGAGRKGRDEQRVYRCEHCHGFHLTSTPKR
ncbi:hypothetical protein [Streptomyces youssoufiensis]